MHHLGAELASEVDALGAAGQHRLGPDVDGESGDLRAAELAAEPGRPLEQQDGAPGRGQASRGDEPGHSPSDDDHVPDHAVSLGCRVWTPT